ncbi:MAG: tetratricopeptide repeat protein [Deltaproteobacteria bacterium]|nr:tetratricopeptide repeat protein [Deltaproteobacteria bacterium]
MAATLRQEGSVPAAIERLRRAIELDPENAEAELLMGYVHMERNDAAAAEEHLKRGVDLLIAAGREGATLAEARNIWGLSLVTLGRCDDALEPLRAAATDELNRAPHLAWGNLGLAQICLGDDEAALQALREAVQAQPRFCVGYFRMGQVFFAQERLDDADRALTEALDADPSCGESYQEAYALRGEVRARLGRREDAISDFEHCVELGARSESGRSCQHFLEETN